MRQLMKTYWSPPPVLTHADVNKSHLLVVGQKLWNYSRWDWKETLNDQNARTRLGRCIYWQILMAVYVSSGTL